MGQRVEQRNAGEAVAFEALVGLAGGLGDVGRRHGDAQHFFLGERGRRQHRAEG